MKYSLIQRGDPRDKSKPRKIFALAQSNEVLDVDKLAEHITRHGCAYRKADILAMTSILTDAITEQLRQGNQVDLGDLGKFYITLDCEGAPSIDEFDANRNIRAFRPHWLPSKRFLHLREGANFTENVDRRTEKRLLREDQQRRQEDRNA